MKVLVTGGAGFIGSHCSVELLNEGHEVVIVDNLCNSKETVICRIEEITGKKVKFYNIDLRDYDMLSSIFRTEKIEVVMHFAALKSGADSIIKPGLYYWNNIDSTFNIVKLMKRYHVKYMVFSSSATVYGNSENVPIKEDEITGDVISPYGLTKHLCELFLKQCSEVDKQIKVVCLRYFNPVGAHPSGLIGEDSPDAVPNNLMLYILDVAEQKLPYLKVFGKDYNTPDGSGVRDYIHVVDLAKGHVAALKYIIESSTFFDIFNLGTGHGHTVLEVIKQFEKTNAVPVPYRFEERRPGDVSISYASVEKANSLLKWHAEKTLEDALRDLWNFRKLN